MADKDTLLIEYQEGAKKCMHYENLRRNGLMFLVAVQGGIMSVVFGLENIDLVVGISMAGIAIFVGLFVLNNEVRLTDYFREYLGRVKQIEAELDMQLYTRPKKILTKSISNRHLFKAFPIITSFFWIVYIIVCLLNQLKSE